MRKGLISIFIGIALPFSVFASTGSEPKITSEQKPTFEQYISDLKKEGLEKGIDKQLMERAFDGIKYRQRAVKADRNQPEKRLTLDEYLPKAVPNWKIKKARRLYEENRKDLDRIGAMYGVQPKFLVALWGIESNFGDLTGNFNVIEALTTLAFDGRREAFFRGQVFDALTILQQGHIEEGKMKGSWAGAMGQCQFMPSSFLSYAADGNNDGKKDIWTSKPDVFASSANYLKQAGWNDQFTWGREITLPKDIDNKLIGLGNGKEKSLSQWQDLGIRTADNKALPDVNINAWLIRPDDDLGRSYLVYDNYNSLMKWNRSHYFALAVSQLADKI